ncbi:YgjV family protein [Treponema sp. OttesenSCG-928-L16]|nr:YgjV family protein [Treponema sp. OttesenSCG-928-L16]
MMNWSLFVEWFGIAASVLVALSLTMKNIKRLRMLNLAGSFAFALYGLWIKSIPVLVLNLFTVGVNIFYLLRAAKQSARSETFELMFVNPKTNDYLKRFIRFHGHDIVRFFPSFSADPEKGTVSEAECCLILRELVPVSLEAYRRNPDGEVDIVLDYTIPAYRDFKNARFFFDSAASQIAPSGTIFNASAEVPAHEQYLRRMGFEECGRTETARLFRKRV